MIGFSEFNISYLFELMTDLFTHIYDMADDLWNSLNIPVADACRNFFSEPFEEVFGNGSAELALNALWTVINAFFQDITFIELTFTTLLNGLCIIALVKICMLVIDLFS